MTFTHACELLGAVLLGLAFAGLWDALRRDDGPKGWL